MYMREKTEHELFWKGNFGDLYTDRNRCGEKMRKNDFLSSG